MNPTAREVITEGPFLGIPTAAGLVAAGYLAYACAVYLPRAWNSYRPHGGHEDRVHSRPAPAFQLSLGTRP